MQTFDQVGSEEIIKMPKANDGRCQWWLHL